MLISTGEETWELLGSLPTRELAKLVGQAVAAQGVSTVSGWVTHRLGGFPKRGDTLLLGEHELTVEEMDGPRIARLKLKRKLRTEPARLPF